MEQHRYVDATLEVYRRVLRDFANIGVCLQAYLYRTKEDLVSLIPLGGGIRLVKGAYREPPDVAMPNKRNVDESFLALAKMMMSGDAQASGLRAVFGTHDRRLVAAIHEQMRAFGASARIGRVPLALRDSARRAGPAGAGAIPRARAHQLRRTVVSMVHAEVGRTSGKRAVCREVDAVEVSTTTSERAAAWIPGSRD